MFITNKAKQVCMRKRPNKVTCRKNECYVFGGNLLVKYLVWGTGGMTGWEPIQLNNTFIGTIVIIAF